MRIIGVVELKQDDCRVGLSLFQLLVMCYLLRFPLQEGDLLAELYMFYIV